MGNITSRIVKVLLASVIGLTGISAPALADTATPAVAQLAAACGDTSSFTEVELSALPAQATDTVDLIEQGGPYPYRQDNGVFGNREQVLPGCSSGYYREYTVKTPGAPNRGARRIVTGRAGEYFYTADHYASFRLVDIRA